jgi:hypothetical protein
MAELASTEWKHCPDGRDRLVNQEQPVGRVRHTDGRVLWRHGIVRDLPNLRNQALRLVGPQTSQHSLDLIQRPKRSTDSVKRRILEVANELDFCLDSDVFRPLMEYYITDLVERMGRVRKRQGADKLVQEMMTGVMGDTLVRHVVSNGTNDIMPLLGGEVADLDQESWYVLCYPCTTQGCTTHRFDSSQPILCTMSTHLEFLDVNLAESTRAEGQPRLAQSRLGVADAPSADAPPADAPPCNEEVVANQQDYSFEPDEVMAEGPPCGYHPICMANQYNTSTYTFNDNGLSRFKNHTQQDTQEDHMQDAIAKDMQSTPHIPTSVPKGVLVYAEQVLETSPTDREGIAIPEIPTFPPGTIPIPTHPPGSRHSISPQANNPCNLPFVLNNLDHTCQLPQFPADYLAPPYLNDDFSSDVVRTKIKERMDQAQTENVQRMNQALAEIVQSMHQALAENVQSMHQAWADIDQILAQRPDPTRDQSQHRMSDSTARFKRKKAYDNGGSPMGVRDHSPPMSPDIDPLDNYNTFSCIYPAYQK